MLILDTYIILGIYLYLMQLLPKTIYLHRFTYMFINVIIIIYLCHLTYVSTTLIIVSRLFITILKNLIKKNLFKDC